MNSSNHQSNQPHYPSNIKCKYYFSPIGCKQGKKCHYNHSLKSSYPSFYESIFEELNIIKKET